ncbi:hypothetical protein DY000_02019239 [Brassica cretica]|uniref:Anaphase-promoting complex subunit 4 WD40 domain-containing protein n=1 Tax=Brassica cretica TaxID=69181 RepID=A0ABQ7DA30_BRACR|nr:hypothetical protein DY000_02019239 [Brassica cretica]
MCGFEGLCSQPWSRSRRVGVYDGGFAGGAAASESSLCTAARFQARELSLLHAEALDDTCIASLNVGTRGIAVSPDTGRQINVAAPASDLGGNSLRSALLVIPSPSDLTA